VRRIEPQGTRLLVFALDVPFKGFRHLLEPERRAQGLGRVPDAAIAAHLHPNGKSLEPEVNDRTRFFAFRHGCSFLKPSR